MKNLFGALRGHSKTQIERLVLLILSILAFPVLSHSSEFTAKTIGDYGNVTVMEVSGNYDANNPDGTTNGIPRQEIAKEFFRLHKDEFDFLVIFSNFAFAMPDASAKAFYLHVKNDTQGIGRLIFDNTALFGSNGKLQGTIDMGNIASLVADPLDPKYDNTLSILAHEFLHRWAAYVKFKDPSGSLSTALLGRDDEHWSFLLNSSASVLYGNNWQDNGNGSFTSLQAEKYYSPLDLYLMGFHDKSQVPPMLLIENPDIDPARTPEAGATITGTAMFVSINDIIAAEGERVPGAAASQKTFKTAFIFITAPGTFTGDELTGIENIRNGWVTRFSVLTDGKGLMQVAVAPLGDIPSNPGVTPPSGDPRSLPPDVSDGVKWLIGDQRADGSWTDAGQTAERDTSEAVLALQNFSAAQQNCDSGIQWLSADISDNTDYLSRKMEALKNSGQDVTGLRNELLARQNADGGWGSNKGYDSNALDSSLTLKSLAKAGYSDPSFISPAVHYLKAAQNSDGGWGEGEESTIETTANVLLAFNTYGQDYGLQDQIDKGAAWLAQRQNTDGGFGNSPSTIYDTSLALLALREFNFSQDIFSSGLDYVLKGQSADGSWNESAYQTALAIEAISEFTIAPDLAVENEDISIIPEALKSLPTTAVLNVNVRNLGQTDVPQARVVLYDGGISTAKIVGEQTLAFAGRSSTTVTFFVQIPDANSHAFYISVDPDNLVKESNESNNTAIKVLFAESTYDFEILSSDITVAPNPVDVFQDVKITSKVTNKGTMNAYNVKVRYYIDDPAGAFDIATATVDIPANSTITNEITWRANKAGDNLPLTVFVDPFNLFGELSEDNNKAVTFISVRGATAPNLTISYKDVTVTPNPADEAGNISISALVKNEGFSTADNIEVRFYKGAPDVDGVLLGTRTIPSLSTGESASVSVDWTNIAESGQIIIYVQADPDNLIGEIRDDDNDAFIVLRIRSLPDLAVSTNSIVFSPPAPKEGDALSIAVTVQNKGEQAVNNVPVQLYNGGTLINSQTLTILEGNSQAGISFVYDTAGLQGAQTIKAVVDPDNTILERDKSNNTASRTFGVQDANLWLTEQYISPNGDGIKDRTQFFFRLNAPAAVKVIVANGRGETVRTFSGPEFENTANGSVEWNGLNDKGILVPDGQYQIRIADSNNNSLGGLFVTVDNNRSSFAEAVGTAYMVDTNLTCLMPSEGQWEYMKGDSGILFSLGGLKSNHVPPYTGEFNSALYSLDLGGGIQKMTPWDEQFPDPYIGNTNDYRLIDYYQTAPGQEKTAVFLSIYRDVGQGRYIQNFNTELWVVEIGSGNNIRIDKSLNDDLKSRSWSPDSRFLTYSKYAFENSFYVHDLMIVDSRENLISTIHVGSEYATFEVSWSPDNDNLAFFTSDSELWNYNISTKEKTKIASGSVRQLLWSPDGSKLAYELSSSELWIYDAGTKQSKIVDSGAWVFQLSWSPDSKFLAFNYSSNSIKIYDMTDGIKSYLVPNGWTLNNYVPTWVESKKVISVINSMTKSKLLALNVDGMNSEISGDVLTGSVSVSPDHMLIAYAERVQNDTEVITISDSEGNKYKVFEKTYSNYYIGLPSPVIVWSSDSQMGAFLINYSSGYDSEFIIFNAKDKKTSSVTGLSSVSKLEFLPDNVYLFGYSEGFYKFINAETGEITSVSLWSTGSNQELSHSGGYLTFNRSVDEASGCYKGKSYFYEAVSCNSGGYMYCYNFNTYESEKLSDLWVRRSLLNLTAELSATKKNSAILLSGTAEDLNFANYQIDYADVNDPSNWTSVMPSSDVPVRNNTFTQWVPPHEGSYYLRLTARDKAGNIAVDREQVSWGAHTMLTGLYKSRDIFSPNNDGVFDTVELHYQVLEPVHLEFNIYDEKNEVVKTFYMEHPVPVHDLITWDGRDEKGNVVPDGKYKIKVLDYEFFVEVDNTPPDVALVLKGIIKDEGLDRPYAVLEGRAIDRTIKNWFIEDGEGINPQTWLRYADGEDLLVAKDASGIPLLSPPTDAIIAEFRGGVEPTRPYGLEWLVNKKFRIIAEDFAGNRSSAMTDLIPEEIIIYDLVAPAGDVVFNCGSTFDVELTFRYINTIRNPISTMMVQARGDQDTVWKDLKLISYAEMSDLYVLISNLQFDFNSPLLFRIQAVDIFGNTYNSNEFSYLPQPTDQGRIICTLSFTLGVSYEDKGCNSISNQAVLNAEFRGLLSGELKTLGYYLKDAQGLHLLREFDLTRESSSPINVDRSALPEGNYVVKAVLKYLNKDANQMMELTAVNNLVVDRVLPNAEITYPAKSHALCPSLFNDVKGNWYGVAVEGTAVDNNPGGRYKLYFGAGENPPTFAPAMTRKMGINLPIEGSVPAQGQLGIWNVTDLKGTEFSLLLRNVDAAGNTSCYTTNFSMDLATEVRVSLDHELFSPNGDGVLDETGIDYEIDEYATVDLKAFRLTASDDGKYTLESTPVRTILSGHQHLEGAEHTFWDGKDDSSAVVPDGLYGIAVSASDSCGNGDLKWTAVEIDNTPPAAQISYPGPGDPLGNTVEVRGTTDDKNFAGYVLEAGPGDEPQSWIVVSSGETPVIDGVLGNWNTFGLQGRWTLRLSATDQVGNHNENKITIDLGLRPALITDFSVVPNPFSPNHDSIFDSTQIIYALGDSCLTILSVADSSGSVKNTFTSTNTSSGIYAQVWDGTDQSGIVVADGTYNVKIRAALVSDPNIYQDEIKTIVVDTAAPIIEIKQPLNNSYLKDAVSVVGSIQDINILEYAISYEGVSGNVIVDSANQNRENYLFGILNNLPEGNYILKAAAKDLAGNGSEKSVLFTIDRTAPKPVIISPAEGEVYGSPKDIITITGSITEANLETYVLRYGQGDNPSQWTDLVTDNAIPSTVNLFSWNVGKTAGIPDGVYTLSLYSTDKAGLYGEARTKVKIDNTPPEAAITFPGDGTFVKSAIDIKGTAYDLTLDSYTVDLSEGQCVTANKWLPLRTSAVAVREGILGTIGMPPSDGDYCIRLTVGDKLANKSETKVNVKIDMHPPAAPVLSGKVDNRTDINLSWTEISEPDLAGYNLYRNGQKVNAGLLTAASYADRNLKDGTYAHTVKAIDFAGNESGPSNEIKLSIDLSGPDAKISSPGSGSMVSGVVEIKGTAYSSNDFKEYRVYVGQGSAPAAWEMIRTSPVPILSGILAEWDTAGLTGPYTIKLESEDISGNVTAQSISVTVDAAAPGAPVILSAADEGSNVTIMWSAGAETDVAGYLLYRNDRLANTGSGVGLGDWKPYLLSCTAYKDKSLPDGTFMYYVFAVDKAGNLSAQSNIMAITIDTHPPAATIIDPLDGSAFSNNVLIKADSPDIDIASVQFQYKKTVDSEWIDLETALSDPPYEIYLEPLALGLTYDQYDIRAIATDRRGQTDPSPKPITITYTDLTAPEPPHDLNALTNGGDVTLSWLANTEQDLDGYNIYEIFGTAKTKINSDMVKVTSYRMTNVPDGAHMYEVTAIDTYRNESAPSKTASAMVYAALIEQPYTPSSQKTIQIKGQKAKENSNVEIHIDSGQGYGLRGSGVSDSAGSFSINAGLELGENRIVSVVKDSLGNISRTSDPLVVVYNEAPSAPSGVSTSVNGFDADLTWNANTEPDISGYNLYRNDEKINAPVSVTSGNTFSSLPSQPYNLPSFAFDGDSFTRWYASMDGMNPVWWEIDLSSAELINHVEIHWESAYSGGKDYEIQVWSGYAWITREKVVGNQSANNIFDLEPPYRTDRMRIYITNSNDDFSAEYKRVAINEISILKDDLVIQPSYKDINLNDGKYVYKVTAVDYYGFESTPSEANLDVGDVTPPDAPLNLTAAASGSDIILNWTPNSEPDLAGYKVYRNGNQGWHEISSVTANAHIDPNLANGVYTYRITAIDKAGNESPSSVEASANVAAALLPAPVIVSATPVSEGGSVNITWEYSGNAAAGFNLYRSQTKGGPYAKVSVALIKPTAFVDAGLTNGLVYYYVVTAVDSLGNESTCSNEASAIPSDIIAPETPELFYPTLPEIPIVSDKDATDVSGSTDPLSTVELFRNGISVGKTLSLEKDTIQTFTIDSGIATPAISPDGKTLAYVKTGGIFLLTLSTGKSAQIIQSGSMPVWSPDGRYLAYRSADKHLNIYKIKTAEITPLTNEVNVNENTPSWSSDNNKIAFIGGASNVWVKNLSSGAISQATNCGSVSVSKISPDGQRLLYLLNQTLYLTDLKGSPAKQISSQTSSFEWSPYNDKVVLLANGGSGIYQIYIYDIGSNTKFELINTTYNKSYPSWSPDGQSIVYGRSSGGYSSLLIASLKSPGQERLLKYWYGNLSLLSWAKAGPVAWSDGNVLGLAYTAGYYCFKDIELEAGENLFHAIATDQSGNASDPCSDISVVVDPNMVPDLEITAADIFAYPPYPKLNEDVAINVTVQNRGGVELRDVKAYIYIMDGSGNLKLLKSEIIPAIASGTGESIGAIWNSGNKTGTYTLIAVVDPDNSIRELNENNNLATKDIYIVAEEGVMLAATLDAKQYQSGQDVKINIDLKNSGPAQDVVVETAIEDEKGNIVTALNPVSTQLAYGAQQSLNLVWNTGTIFAGSYRIHCIVKNASNVLAESSVGFSILPDINVDATLSTDKAAYGANENVTISLDLTNSGLNYIISGLKIKVSVKDIGGLELFTEEREIANLLPGGSSRLNFTWNTGLNPAGDYHVSAQIYNGDVLVSSPSAVFRIIPVIVIVGTLTPERAVVAPGGSAKFLYSLQNTGNSPADGLKLILLLVDREAQAAVGTFEDTLNLVSNATTKGEFTVSLQGYQLKTYSVVLQYVYEGKTNPIANTIFSIKDLTPPVVTIISPEADSYHNGSINISVRALDDYSGADTVEYQIDNSEWKTMLPAGSGIYSITWSALKTDEGARRISFKAIDKAGNASQAVSVLVNIDFTPPKPPVIESPKNNSFNSTSIVEITGIAEPQVIVSLGREGVISTTQSDISGQFIFRQVKLGAGKNTFEFTATDKAGNVSGSADYALYFDISNWFTGTIEASPNPIYQGREESITYNIDNSGNEDISDLDVEVLISDTDTQQVKETFEKSSVISSSGSISGSFKCATFKLPPKTYTAILQVSSALMMKPKTLNTATFEVKPGMEITKTLPDISRVLVWLNYPWQSGQNCPDKELIEKAMEEGRIAYHLSLDKKDFEDEIRNPYYTDIAILGSHSPIEDHISEELREQVYSGKGLISSLFYRENLNESVFGINTVSSLPGSDYLIEIDESELSQTGSLQSIGRALKIEILAPQKVLAWISDNTGKGKNKYPAIIENIFGKGKVLFYAFDIGLSRGDYEKFKLLMNNSLNFIHAPIDNASSIPGSLVPVELTIQTFGGSSDLRIREYHPSGVKILDETTALWITDNPWTTMKHIGPDQKENFLYYIVAPDMAGAFTLRSEVEYLENGSYIPYKSLSLDVTVRGDSISMVGEILEGLQGLAVSNQERSKLESAIKYMSGVQNRTVFTDSDIEQNIDDILKAIDSLISIENVDISNIRLKMGELLKFWEARSYFGGAIQSR